MNRFTLDEAEALLPRIKRVTDEAASEMEKLVRQMRELDAEDPALDRLDAKGRRVATKWYSAVKDLGAEPKGLFTVDFDSGEGFFCWQHPEECIEYFHTYEAGFAGREPIGPMVLH